MTTDPLPALRANNYGRHSTATIMTRIVTGMADLKRVTYWKGQIGDLIRDRAKFGDPSGLHRWETRFDRWPSISYACHCVQCIQGRVAS